MTESTTKSPDPMDTALGAAVRIRRRTIGMSQEALAEQCGVSFQQIQKYENGANRISFSRLVQIARALRCRVTDLLDVLDTPDDEPSVDLDLLSRMRTPGALELLTVYEQLPQDARTALVSFLRILAPGASASVPAAAGARRREPA
ncbi:helix-turn-helix domain-containing protein [Phenylobacterium sp.]|uniref:helix-turn-helix domain-containing protein n=1 Tax=Phenylobacterium sp. TaxID=1871053 RepID=UPI00272F1094|nr:helix-turn-helix transcriptional regulator [Phenylobacterium sp.]MDP1875097.1 helix-turn-helix transcriptional regulator [Phenylobacterium sp.]MDP3490736.1 helix-turn-helix transcriptional regulator [Phenylobacterium sp.]